MIVGHAVTDYFTYLWGRDISKRTKLDYEKTLYKFVGAHPTTELAEFEPPHGAELIEQWLAAGWGHTTAGTRLKIMAAVAGFFDWAVKRERMLRNPMLLLERPRRRPSPRRAHSPRLIMEIVDAQPLLRDRVALLLMGQIGLRKDEVRLLQIRDFDLERRKVRFKQKGGAVVDHRLHFKALIETLTKHIAVDERGPLEYLIYPRWARMLDDGTVVVGREERNRPLSTRGFHDWYVRCLERAAADHFCMHELRHSAGTEFHRAGHDLELTRQFMRHASVATTAIYMHLDEDDMTAALEQAEARWGERGQPVASETYSQQDSQPDTALIRARATG